MQDLPDGSDGLGVERGPLPAQFDARQVSVFGKERRLIILAMLSDLDMLSIIRPFEWIPTNSFWGVSKHALILSPLYLSLRQKLSPAHCGAIEANRLRGLIPLPFLLNQEALEVRPFLPLLLNALILAVEHQPGIVARLVHEGLANVDLGLESARRIDLLDMSQCLLEGLAVTVQASDLLLKLVTLFEPLPNPGQLLECLLLQQRVDLAWDLGPEVLNGHLEELDIGYGNRRVDQRRVHQDDLLAKPLA